MSVAGNAADVHKCATPTGIAYQGFPCDGAELPTSIVAASATQAPRAVSATAATAPAARATQDCEARPRQAPRRLPWRHAAICIGMTDDEVLNLPGWGRPAKIIRTRAPREWHEDWTYDARTAGPRQLHFVNGRLAAVETELADASAGPIASVASN
jgi:hypothetical protein